MKIISLIITLIISSFAAKAQIMDSLISSFSNHPNVLTHVITEDEWKFARYAFSKIDSSFYKKKRTDQLRDTSSIVWFDKVFTRGEGENYSFDFDKIQQEASKVEVNDLEDVKDFLFIGMKIPLLEKTTSITSLNFKNSSLDARNNFKTIVDKQSLLHEILVQSRNDNGNIMMLKNKDPNIFDELIIFIDDNIEMLFIKLKGEFSISDVSTPM